MYHLIKLVLHWLFFETRVFSIAGGVIRSMRGVFARLIGQTTIGRPVRPWRWESDTRRSLGTPSPDSGQGNLPMLTDALGTLSINLEDKRQRNTPKQAEQTHI